MSPTTPAAHRWSAIIDEQAVSGQTIRAFAAERGLNPNTLAWWRHRLGRTRRSRRQPRAAFVELVVADAMDGAASGTSRSDQRSWPLTLRIGAGEVRIEVSEDTDLALLRDVVEALC